MISRRACVAMLTRFVDLVCPEQKNTGESCAFSKEISTSNIIPAMPCQQSLDASDYHQASRPVVLR